MAPTKKSATTNKAKAAKLDASTAKASTVKASTAKAKANPKATTASQPRTRVVKRAVVDNKENMEIDSAKDEDDAMEDDDVAEQKAKSKAQPASKVGDTDAKAIVNKAPASQCIMTRAKKK